MGELLDNFLKVYQLANFIKHQRLEDQLSQQRTSDLAAERARNNAEQDFAQRMKLEDIGATPVQPIGDIQPGFGSDILAAGKKRQFTTPAGDTYQVPTFEERQQRLLDKIKTEGEAKSGIAIGQAAAIEDVRQRIRAAYAKDPNLHFNTVTQGEDMVLIGSDPRTGEEKSRQVFKGAGRSANVSLRSYMDEQTGTRITEVRDPKTGNLIRKEVEQGAVTARPAKTAAPDNLSAGAKSSWGQFEKAKAGVDALPAGSAEEKAAKATALKSLGAMRDRIVLVYGNELEKGPSEGGWPDIVPKKKAAAAATPTSKSFPASRLSEFARTKGMDVTAARKYIAAQGYAIEEDK